MSRSRGHKIALSLPRRFICDLVHFAKQVPSVPVQRSMHLAELNYARAAASPKPSWCSIFTKALAIVAAERPELRRAYLRFPWPHLFEAYTNVASIAVERKYYDEDAVFFGRIDRPEERSLQELDEKIRHLKNAPLESVGSFKQSILVSKIPWPLRRMIWWLGLNLAGKFRCQRLGTFGVSSYSGLGANSLHPLTPVTITLNYGPVGPDGEVDVRLIYDHRVMDGATIARALADMERVLTSDILSELNKTKRDVAA
jgi:hypothetical protein